MLAMELRQQTILNGRSHVYTYYNPMPWLSIKTMSNGQALYEIDGGRFVVDEGGYLILNHEQAYTIHIDSPTTVESFCVFFPPGWAEDVRRSAATPDAYLLDDPSLPVVQPVSFFERLYPHDTLVSPQIAQLRVALQQERGDAGYLEEKLRLLLAGMLYLQADIQREIARVPAARPGTRVELYRRLHRARDYMHASLGEALTITDIAAVAELSPYHFMRSFKEVFGQRPHAYLTQRRLERARFLLARTDQAVTHICFEVGFESPGAFSSLFHRQTGLSPRAYRQRHRAGR